MSREAVLLQWERKIEAAERLEGGRPEGADAERRAGAGPDDAGGRTQGAERRNGGRFARSSEEREGAGRAQDAEPRDGGRFARSPDPREGSSGGRPALQLVESPAEPEPARFERAPDAQPRAERRTITITGQPTPARRRRSLVESQIAQPDRIALWAFLLGLFLVAVAAGTAHA